MKILYAIQATGNGHISRAMELLPYLDRYGKVDLFLSGANSSLSLDAPVKYRSKGLSLFYTCDGSLDYKKMFRYTNPYRVWKEIRDLPVEKYDLVINDFECITSQACARKKIPSVHFGHQASFLSPNTPRPEKKSKVGEWILRNYASASQSIGLHFRCYDDFIFSPVIKEEILRSEPNDKGFITVYLPAYCKAQLESILKRLPGWRFEIFLHEAAQREVSGNCTFNPVDKASFNHSLVNCHGLITGGGFETPAEALYLKKKLLVIPIRGQYEQLCNAAALKELGVPVLEKLDDDFPDHFNRWIHETANPGLEYEYTTEAVVNMLMFRCTRLGEELEIPYPHLVFN